MDHDRLPRLTLFSWIRHKCKKNGQYMTIGRRLMRNLNDIEAMGTGHTGRTSGHTYGRNGMDRGWVDYAQDRGAWRRNVVQTAVGPFAGQMPDYTRKKRTRLRQGGDDDDDG